MSDFFLWKFYLDCGSQGELEGLFVATEEDISHLIGKCCYFGEVLGKHSDVGGIIEKTDISKVELDSYTVNKVADTLGNTWCGFNPMKYVSE